MTAGESRRGWIEVRSSVAAAVIALTWAQLWIQWCDRELWLRVAHAVGLTPWAVTGAIAIALTLAITLPTTRVTARTFGITPRLIVQAIGCAIAVWLLYQLGCAIDRAWFGAAKPIAPDVAGDLLGAYGEELPYRVIVIGAVASRVRRRPLITAVVVSSLLFALAHLPGDIATGAIHDPTRMPVRLVYGALLAWLYLETGNVLLAAALHAMVDGPILLVAGPHQVAVTSAINWAACAAIAGWYTWNRRRTRGAVSTALRASSHARM